jgi:aryl-alcohol dehydrogenase-like predicted oxidoreductase
MSKIVLGTAQFGMPYGVANSNGKLSQIQIREILLKAKSNGISSLDTAIGYGNSETNIGKSGIKGLDIITKLSSPLGSNVNIKSWVQNQIQNSLSRLNIDYLSGVLLHDVKQLRATEGKETWFALQNLKKYGLIKKIGFSIYDTSELDEFFLNFQPDIVQAPYNVLDRRLANTGWLQKIHDENVEIHVRSVFLQGLLLMKKNQRPEKFNYWSNIWEEWETWLKENNYTALQTCLAFALLDNSINKVIIGIDSLIQLEEILSTDYTKITRFPCFESINNLDLINPTRWNSL